MDLFNANQQTKKEYGNSIMQSNGKSIPKESIIQNYSMKEKKTWNTKSIEKCFINIDLCVCVCVCSVVPMPIAQVSFDDIIHRHAYPFKSLESKIANLEWNSQTNACTYHLW